jgi:putative transposase
LPSRGAVQRRIAKLDPVKATAAREGRDRARARHSAGGTPPPAAGVLERVQIDHTSADVIVVDERHRLPIGRPYVTAAIDEASRCVPGFVVTLEAPSATSVGLCLAHMAIDKRAWMERLGVETVWPMSGKPRELYVDNAAEFKSEALRRGCDQHGIRIEYRPPGQPHHGGVVERLIGTMMRMLHELPGTTFSNTGERGDYDSDAKAILTLRELQRWLALAVACYHGEPHEGLGGRTPSPGCASWAAPRSTRTPCSRWWHGCARSPIPPRPPPARPAATANAGQRHRPGRGRRMRSRVRPCRRPAETPGRSRSR